MLSETACWLSAKKHLVDMPYHWRSKLHRDFGDVISVNANLVLFYPSVYQSLSSKFTNVWKPPTTKTMGRGGYTVVNLELSLSPSNIAAGRM